jgi:putative membrane protein
MKKYNILVPAFVGLLVLAACNSGNKGSSDVKTATDSMSSYDSATTVTDAADTASNNSVSFAVKAGSGGMMEVQLGELAQTNAQSARVKAFGAMMVRDHSKANKELLMIAANKQIGIPSNLSEEHQRHVEEMKKLKGEDFDEHYMDMMTKDHKEDIDLFEKAAENEKDNDIKAFASKTLPTLRAHLDSAKAVKDAIK